MRLNLKMLSWGAAALTGFLFMSACTNDDTVKPTNDQTIEIRGPGNTALIGLSPANELVSIVAGPPALETGRVAITGLRSEELIVAIDTRPKNKQLFGISNQSVLYLIDPVSGIATPVSGQPLSPAINGSLVGFDFSPADDVIRLITDLGQALRISPTTGAVIGVDAFFGGGVNPINSIAFSFATRTSRVTLYDLDANNGNLYKQSSYNGGSLALVGPTGFFFEGEGGFEITSANAGFTVQYGRSRYPAGFGTTGFDDITQDSYRLLYINLLTGKATSWGKVSPMIGLAVK